VGTGGIRSLLWDILHLALLSRSRGLWFTSTDPPLSCRTSPPQGGRSAASTMLRTLRLWGLAKAKRPA